MMWALIPILLIVFSAAVAGISAAPWLPTKPSQRQHLLAQLPLNGNEHIYDLGCGDGSMLFAIARKYPNARCTGYDISLLPLLLAWTRKAWSFQRYRNVHIRFGNLFTQSLHDADVVFVFLLTKAYPRLVEKFRSELKSDARVLVEAWPLPEMSPSVIIDDVGMLKMYVYEGKRFR